MPTPSSNSPLFAPLSAIDAISTRTTCPPEGEIDRILWREPPLARIDQDTDEETTPTATSFANSAASSSSSLNPADATTQQDQRPQQQQLSASAQQNKDSVVADEDVTLAPLSPATSVSTEGKDELAVSPHTTSSVVGANAAASYMSSLNYEFSNVRVSRLSVAVFPRHISIANFLCALFRCSYSPITPPRSSGLVANSSEHNSPTVRSTMSTLRSSMLT
jgi:hypothetical protein